MNIDHIGIAVKSIEDGIKHWEHNFEYRQMTEIVINSRQKVKVVFMEKPDAITVKLIEPVDKNSPIYNFTRHGGGLHHICFKCNEINEELKKLKTAGFRITARPQPGEAFDNEKIAFLYSPMGMNIELIDTDKKANRIN